jgi:hypothetical protein
MLEKDLVPNEQSLELKELGFDEPCLVFYNGTFLESTQYIFDDCSMMDIGQCLLAPTYSQAFRWFREKHGLYANLSSWTHEEEIGIYHEFEIYGSPHSSSVTSASDTFETYEEMELACIKKLIKITNEQQKTTK